MASVAPEVPGLARDRAFERLYRRYVKDVYHYALALLRNPADAEDVTQTTFMNAYRAYKRGEEPLKPQNWLIKIAHNAARTRYARSTRRVNEVPLEDHVEQLAVPEEERPDVEEVLRALGRLPLNQRAALVMRELEGRSYAEIADTLGVSVAAVETLIFRARRSLKLKTSAIRVLGAVPLPPSLTGLFESGGAVAGGGVAVGAGYLLKAAVAVVAGAVATGVGGSGQPGTAEAAAPRAQTIAAPPWPAGLGFLRQRADRPGAGAYGASRALARTPRTASHRLLRIADSEAAATGPSSATPVTTTVHSAPAAAGAPSAADALASPTSTVSEVSSTLESATQAVSVQAPALPAVSVPSLPLPPVSVPEAPPLPKLP